MTTLVIIGAGPKAVAIAAKTVALSVQGFAVPRVVIVERSEVGANWTGNHGYTSGSHRLGTPPEKDLGFPYAGPFGVDVERYMLAYYSWQSYLIATDRRGYGPWMDRGRPHPFHHEWAKYLAWALEQTLESNVVQFVQGEVMSAVPTMQQWDLKVQTVDGSQGIKCDGVVVTGPGKIRSLPVILDEDSSATRAAKADRLFNGDEFWTHLERIDALPQTSTEIICIIGSGETAASVVVELLERRPLAQIVVVNTQGTIFSRGEGFHENRLFTDASDEWAQLPEITRRGVIGRADRGVFSQDTVSIVNWADTVTHKYLRVTGLHITTNDPSLPMVVVGESIDERTGLRFQTEIPATLVVNATGFDPWSFGKIFDCPFLSDEKERENIVRTIGHDLAVTDTLVQSKLHLPMLSALSQGPGFPNLSCLGSVADRILAPYLTMRPIIPLFRGS